MARHVEPLDRGLVTIRDPALLKPGELSYVRNAVYLPGSNALQRARGRTAFGTATATAADVAGLRDLKFDNGNHYLLAHCTASYVTALVGDTGTFGVLVSGIGVGSQLEAVHYRNRYFLLNGTSSNASAIGSNRVVYLSATATAAANALLERQHGLLPVISAPTVTTASGTFSQTVTGYYEYWTTEVAKITQDGESLTLESSFSSDTGPTTVFISAVGQVPTIQLPTPRNSITTHWRIYRSPKKEKQTDKKFPSGFMISDIGTATATQADTSVTASASAFPGSFNTSSPYADFTNRTNLGADDNTYASATAVGLFSPKYQACYGFNLGGFSGSVKGIAVEFQGYISSGSGNVPVEAIIGRRASDGGFQPRKQFGANFAAKSGIITATASATPQTVVLGGASDRWFASDNEALSDTELTDGNFMVALGVSRANVSVGFDYLKATVYYGATVDSVVPFPSVVYTFGDQTFSVGKNHPPPSSSTGTLFQDSLVVNDVANPSFIRWSFPGDPEVFPPSYFMDFETRENDQVRFVGVVNNRLVVGLDSSLWRVNYLPSERDATFDRGSAVEAITRNYGVVNPMCACVFSTDGTQERIAFVSNQGIHATDGFNLETYSDVLDWRGDRDGVGIANTGQNYAPIALINDRERQELLFYFRNDAFGGGRYHCLHFQYNELVDGKPRVAGLVNMENDDNTVSHLRAVPKSAWAVPRSTGRTDVYIGYGTAVGAISSALGAGQVYRETGTDIPALSSTRNFSYATRRMFLAGMGNEWRLNELYGYCGLVTWPADPGQITYTLNNRKTNSTIADGGSKSFSFTTAGGGDELLHRVPFNSMCEGAIITAVMSTQGDFSQELLVIDGEGFGVEDSGK